MLKQSEHDFAGAPVIWHGSGTDNEMYKARFREQREGGFSGPGTAPNMLPRERRVRGFAPVEDVEEVPHLIPCLNDVKPAASAANPFGSV
ncbi:UNVERIFIED_CONTAM: hypothetical protein K2H54_037985 [Gekko kuhli]